MKSKIICEMSGQDIKMLMILFLHFAACTAVSHLPSAAPRAAWGWLTFERERNPQRPVWMGGGVVFTNSMYGRLQDKGLFGKKIEGWMFICNCEIVSCHGLQPSEVSTTIPILKAQAVTSCECQEQWLKKNPKRLFATLCWAHSPSSPPTKAHPGRWLWHREDVCLTETSKDNCDLWTST